MWGLFVEQGDALGRQALDLSVSELLRDECVLAQFSTLNALVHLSAGARASNVEELLENHNEKKTLQLYFSAFGRLHFWLATKINLLLPAPPSFKKFATSRMVRRKFARSPVVENGS